MDPDTIKTICGVGGTVLGLSWAAFERARNAKTNDALRVAVGKDDVIAVKDQIISAKEEEHKEYMRYREESHKRFNESNDRILLLTRENADLRTRSDLSPIVENQRQQGEVILKILDAMTKLTYRMEHILNEHETKRVLP